jgi:hypothetical protein
MIYPKKTKMIMMILFIILAASVLAMMTGQVLVLAADYLNVGLFELDGNAIDEPQVSDDWSVLNSTGHPGVVFSGVIADPGQNTVFVGGKKDIQDISQWGWKDNGGFPDKDDITNAYAAAYKYNGDLIIYFGADRFANNGDAFLGFWFFQNEVVIDKTTGTFKDRQGNPAKHSVGDILVIVNYPQASNASPIISVAEWNPAEADVATNLKLLVNTAQCGVSVPGQDVKACAITNTDLAPIPSPWTYTPKSGAQNFFPYESFFEGGMNITRILGFTPCFSSFMAESRSSDKFTATLKDFVLGSFPVCGIAVSKACKVARLTDENDNTDKYFYVEFSGQVSNTGAGAIPKDAEFTIVDDAGTPNDTTDDVTIKQTLTNDLAPGNSVPFSGYFYSDANPPYNTVNASVTFSGATLMAVPFSIDCQKLPLNPNLSLSKSCWTKLESIDSLLAVKAFFKGEVCNKGDVPLFVTVTDDPVGEVLPKTLILPPPPGATQNCKTIDERSYLPLQANGNETDPCKAMFSDTFTATVTSPIPGVSLDPVTATANCPLCDCK